MLIFYLLPATAIQRQSPSDATGWWWVKRSLPSDASEANATPLEGHRNFGVCLLNQRENKMEGRKNQLVNRFLLLLW